MTIRYRVDLSEAEHAQRAALRNGGKHAARKIKRAQILLAADGGVRDEMIAKTISIGESTVYRTKRGFVEGNLDLALSEAARPGAAQAVGQGDGVADRHRLLQPAGRAQALDARSVGWGDGEAHRAWRAFA
jgi:hypothetical protein